MSNLNSLISWVVAPPAPPPDPLKAVAPRLLPPQLVMTAAPSGSLAPNKSTSLSSSSSSSSVSTTINKDTTSEQLESMGQGENPALLLRRANAKKQQEAYLLAMREKEAKELAAKELAAKEESIVNKSKDESRLVPNSSLCDVDYLFNSQATEANGPPRIASSSSANPPPAFAPAPTLQAQKTASATTSKSTAPPPLVDPYSAEPFCTPIATTTISDPHHQIPHILSSASSSSSSNLNIGALATLNNNAALSSGSANTSSDSSRLLLLSAAELNALSKRHEFERNLVNEFRQRIADMEDILDDDSKIAIEVLSKVKDFVLTCAKNTSQSIASGSGALFSSGVAASGSGGGSSGGSNIFQKTNKPPMGEALARSASITASVPIRQPDLASISPVQHIQKASSSSSSSSSSLAASSSLRFSRPLPTSTSYAKHGDHPDTNNFNKPVLPLGNGGGKAAQHQQAPNSYQQSRQQHPGSVITYTGPSLYPQGTGIGISGVSANMTHPAPAFRFNPPNGVQQAHSHLGASAHIQPFDGIDDEILTNFSPERLAVPSNFGPSGSSVGNVSIQHGATSATTAAANIVDDDEIEPIELSQPDEAHLAYIDEDDEVTENPGDLMSDTQQNQQLWKRANEINHHVFHHNNFRGKQGLTIASALRGEDVFVLMPTGGGKSLCYQLTALVCGGLTIVVCPLVALMREQVLQLQQMGVNSAFLSADQLDEDKKSVYRAINGYKDTVDMRLLYVTPERMSRDMHFWDSMKKLEKKKLLDRFVIDEAHCVSQWGHDFREDYLSLRICRQTCPSVPIMALTATATAQVVADVLKVLCMAPVRRVDVDKLKLNAALLSAGLTVYDDESRIEMLPNGAPFMQSGAPQRTILKTRIFRNSFNRLNLFYDIRPQKEVEKQIKALVESYIKDSPALQVVPRSKAYFLAGSGDVELAVEETRKRQEMGHRPSNLVSVFPWSGIIYCKSRKDCEQASQKLNDGIGRQISTFYHATVEKAQKESQQDNWMRGEVPVMFATIAFGMGINKPNVRFVVHSGMPSSVTGFYQESGRAGRDGKPALCILFWNFSDRARILKQLESDHAKQKKDGVFVPARAADQKRRLTESVNNMIGFCSNEVECRRTIILKHFGEPFERARCKMMCSTCKDRRIGIPIDMTYESALACMAVNDVKSRGGPQAHGPTVIQLTNAFDSIFIIENNGKRSKSKSISAPTKTLGLLASTEWNDFGPRVIQADFKSAAVMSFGGFGISQVYMNEMERGPQNRPLSEVKAEAIRFASTGKLQVQTSSPAAVKGSSAEAPKASISAQSVDDRKPANGYKMIGSEALMVYCGLSPSRKMAERLIQMLVVRGFLQEDTVYTPTNSSFTASNTYLSVTASGNQLINAFRTGRLPVSEKQRVIIDFFIADVKAKSTSSPADGDDRGKVPKKRNRADEDESLEGGAVGPSGKEKATRLAAVGRVIPRSRGGLNAPLPVRVVDAKMREKLAQALTEKLSEIHAKQQKQLKVGTSSPETFSDLFPQDLVLRLASFAPQSLHEVRLVNGIEAPDESVVPDNWKSDGVEAPRKRHAKIVGSIPLVIKKFCAENKIDPGAAMLQPPPIEATATSSSSSSTAPKRQKKAVDKHLSQSQVPDFHDIAQIQAHSGISAMPKPKPKAARQVVEEQQHFEHEFAPRTAIDPIAQVPSHTINVDEDDEILLDEGGGEPTQSAASIHIDLDEEELDAAQLERPEEKGDAGKEEEEGEEEDDDEDIPLAQ
jgi:superfamily II DNA helicase RecQ